MAAAMGLLSLHLLFAPTLSHLADFSPRLPAESPSQVTMALPTRRILLHPTADGHSRLQTRLLITAPVLVNDRYPAGKLQQLLEEVLSKPIQTG